MSNPAASLQGEWSKKALEILRKHSPWQQMMQTQ
jgi:hypothetical protein